MFSVFCQCGRPVNIAAARLNQPVHCPSCQRSIVCVSAEPLDAAAAAADFDAALLVIDGPERAGEFIRVGGSGMIDIGTDPSSDLILHGEGILPWHCRLVRISHGPSRWKIENISGDTNVCVEDESITARELADGDTFQIGPYEIAYMLTRHAPQEFAPGVQSPATALPSEVETSILRAKTPPLVATPERADDWPVCPSCQRELDADVSICVDCGIDIDTGRPLFLSEGFDENTVYGNAEALVRVVSCLLPFTPLPIPLASSSYGKYKPYATWTIAAITLIASCWFLAVSWGGDSGFAKRLALWPTHPNFFAVTQQEIQMLPHLQMGPDGIPRETSDEERREQVIREHRRASADFHWWQFFTYALIEDANFLPGFLISLFGNLLFLIVFGARVNGIIGNRAIAIIYPLLVAGSGLIFFLALPAGARMPLRGAAGAVNGLAGLYLVLQPAHYVYCATWFRFFRELTFKIFALRGFWLILIYVAFDVAMMLLGNQGTADHYANIGGFLLGVMTGLALLITRTYHFRNGDLLSLVLGKHAWPLIGKPSDWAEKPKAPTLTPQA